MNDEFEVVPIERTLYFAYGSNMNVGQMMFRCPDAQRVETVRLEDYCLAFRTNGVGNGVATVLPEPGSHVTGVLWRISERDEERLDLYEGFPILYGKEPVMVKSHDGRSMEVMAYTINPPYRDVPALPSPAYLEGILNGCRQNGLSLRLVREAVERTRQEPMPEGIRRPKPFQLKRDQER